MSRVRKASGKRAKGGGPGKGPSVTGRVSAILGVVWGGLFAYEGFAGVLLPGQLFLPAALGLVLGALLTLAVLWFGLRFAEVAVAGGEAGGESAGHVRATARAMEQDRDGDPPRRLAPPPQG